MMPHGAALIMPFSATWLLLASLFKDNPAHLLTFLHSSMHGCVGNTLMTIDIHTYQSAGHHG